MKDRSRKGEIFLGTNIKKEIEANATLKIPSSSPGGGKKCDASVKVRTNANQHSPGAGKKHPIIQMKKTPTC